MKVHLRTLGCRLNQSEIDSMTRQFEQLGHQTTNTPDEADAIVINTCAVTHEAVRAGRRMIRETHRHNTQAQIIVTGCHAQIAPDEIAVLPGVSQVVDNRSKDALVSRVTGQPLPRYDLEPLERAPDHRLMRTRAFIKVQDGCDNACTFCVTTIARGDGRSRPPEAIIAEINALYAGGYQECVLTGVHLGSYGHDAGDHDGLRQLVLRILRETDMPRLRLSSLEPWDISPDFFALWQDDRLCPHLHLPLQSGSDSVLKRMRRQTTTHEFRSLVRQARAAIADLKVTTDIIVGFPGETDDLFEQSLAFVAEMDFAGLHVFRYSRRPGTPAARMHHHIPEDMKRTRSQRMIDLSTASEMRFAQRYLGQTRPVLWENVSGATPEGFVNTGYTDHYVRVRAIHPHILTDHITPARLLTFEDGLIQAEAVLQ